MLQSLGAAALILAVPFAIILFVRWVFTSKVGAVVGFLVAILIMAVVLSTPNHPNAAVQPEQTVESRVEDLERMAKEIRARQLANQPLSKQ
jgi:hypothetical protein